jgi:hypothetical protein
MPTTRPASNRRQPAELLTLRGLARRVPCSTRRVSDFVRTGQIVPDFLTASGLVMFRACRAPSLIRRLKPAIVRQLTRK